MKTPHWTQRVLYILTVLFVFAASFSASAVSAVEIIRNGDFSSGLLDWNIDPEIDPSWNPLADGAVSLNPPSSGFMEYTGLVIYQNLNADNIGGKTLQFSMDLSKVNAWNDHTIQVELTYVTTSDTMGFIEFGMPPVADVSSDPSNPTIFTSDVAFPADARKLIKIEIFKENTGGFITDNISLVDSTDTVTIGVLPQISDVSANSGAYGSVLTITGTNFGATQGFVSIGGSSNGITVTSWSDTSIDVTVNDPARSGRVYVVADHVESNTNFSFEVTSPNYTVNLKNDDLTAVKGQVAEYVIAIDFLNDFATTSGITFSIDPSTLPAGAITTFTPVPLKNAGGVLLKIDTSAVAAGDYSILLKTEEANTQPRYVPFLLEVVTINSINFYRYVYNPLTQTNTREDVTQIDLTAQGQFNSYGLQIDATDSLGNTQGMMAPYGMGMPSPLTISSDNPLVVMVEPTTWGPNYYALTAGSANIVVTATDGAQASLPVTITIGETAPQVQVSITPSSVPYSYAGDLSFSATGNYALTQVGTSVSGMTSFSSNRSEKGTWYDSNRSYASTFQMLDQEPGAFTVMFHATTSDGTTTATGNAPLQITADPALAQISGGVRTLDDLFAENFILEFYNAAGTKAFERELFMFHSKDFHLVGIPVGDYRIRIFHEDYTGAQIAQWYPNAETIDGAQVLTFNAGETVDNVYFFLSQGPSISFTGLVRASNVNSPIDGTPIAGATVSSADNANISTTTDTLGAFTLSGLPVNTPFALQITATNYVPVYSQTMNTSQDVVGLWPFVMFTPTELAGWPIEILPSGTGFITGRVVDAANPSQPVAGVKVTYTSALSGAYNVAYFDGMSFTSGETATTSANGLYYIYGITPGDAIAVQGAKDGWAFQGPAFHSIHSDSAHEGLILGTATSPPEGISFTGMVADSLGAGIEGATVFMAENPSLFTTTVTGGAFTLEGLPVDTAFTLGIAKLGYVSVFSAVIRSAADIENTNIPFILFTPADVAAWGIESGKGVITGRVWDKSFGSGIQNAEVFCTSMLGQTYAPVYPGSTTGTTAADGRYLIPNVLEGDMVAVTAQLSAFVFDGRVFMTHGDAVSEGYIFSASDGDTLALRGAFDAAMVEFNAKNLGGFMAYVSENYLDDGLTKTGFAAELTEEFSDPEFQGETYTVLNTVIDGTSATMMVLWNGREAELLHFVNESGAWKIYGNQKLFEVMARSGYQAQSTNPDIYWVSLEVEDPGNLITSVTVTGDGIDGSIALYHDAEDEEEWHSWSESPEQTNNNPTFGNTRPALPLSYTFTIEYGSGQQVVQTVPVNYFVEVFPTNLSPVQSATVSGDLAFSWMPIPGFSHGIELFDSTWNQIWSAHDLQSGTIAYDGPALADGTYTYMISSDDPEGNYSLLQTSFTYQATAPALTPDVMYMHSAQGYQLELILEGEVTGIASVTVTGPENSGIVDFPLNGEYDEFWAVYPSDTAFITEGFPENYAGTYTFTATYTDQHTETFTYDFQPGTPGALPAGVKVNAAGILSWAPNTAVDHYYYIVYDGAGNVVRNTENDTPLHDTNTVNLYSLLGAYDKTTGTYSVQLVAVYASGDEAYAEPVYFDYREGDEDKGYVIGGVYCQNWTQASGAMHVIVYSDQAMQTPVAGLEEVFNENPAQFLIFGLTPGVDYYVGAYLDSNGDNQRDEGEPFAEAQYNPVQVTALSQTNAGGINLVAGGPAGVSFFGWVRDTQDQVVPGAQAEARQPTGDLIGTHPADGALGAFMLTDIPVGQAFYLSIPQPADTDYAPVLSRYMTLQEDTQALLPYRLFTGAEYAAFGNDAGTGMILGRVAMQNNPMQFLAGATIEVQRWTPMGLVGDPLQVTYTGGGNATAEDGLYMVKNVPVMDEFHPPVLYQVTATLDGYTFTFNNALVPVAAGTVTEDSIFATGEAGLQARMLYMRFTGGDQLEMILKGDVADIASVTVTGPGNSGILNFPLNPGVGEDEGEFWAVYPSDTSFITEEFPESYTGWYTFIATYADQHTETRTFDFQPGTPLEVPANVGVNGDTGMLAWDAVDGAAGYYLVITDVGNQMEVYNGEADPMILQSPFDLFTALGQRGVPSGEYTVQVVAVDGPFGNEAYADPAPFFYQGGAAMTISFTGKVVDSEGNAIQGAEVMLADNWSHMVMTGTDGTFTLGSLPIDTPFTLRIFLWGYADSYSAIIRSGTDIDSTGTPFKLFTPDQVEAWGVEAGKGVITGRVLDRTSGFAVPNAVVSYTSLSGQSYTVVYPGSAEATGAEGTYRILNIADGDRVIVTATCPGFAFDGRVFMTHAYSVSEGSIFGASDGATLTLRSQFDAAMVEFNSGHLEEFMACVSEDYLDDGQTKAGFRAELAEEFSDPGFDGETYVVLGSFIDGEMGYLTVLWNGVEREVIPFKYEGGAWQLYGNQKLFEVMARSGHQAASANPDTYWVSLEVEDPGDMITGVTVTGDGIDGSLALYHDPEDKSWNSWQENNNPTFGNMRPELPLTYTFTVNYQSQEKTETVTVANFVEVFPYDAAPWEGQTVTGDFAFSWTPVPGFIHGIELFDMNWNRVWEKYDVQGGLVEGQVQVAYDGPALEGGRYYYNVVTSDSDGNYSLLQTSFTYALPGPVPSLGQAILVLQALTGQNPTGLEAVRDVNNDGRIGLIEAMYVLQTNAGLVTPLPVTSESGTAELTSRAWNDNDGFDFSEATTKRVQIIDDMYDWQDTDFIVETNIIFLAPGVEAQDLGVLSLSDVNRVPIDGYGPTLDVILDPAHVYAFRLFDGTYAAIQFTETAVDQGNDTFKSTFNYKYQPNWSANF